MSRKAYHAATMATVATTPRTMIVLRGNGRIASSAESLSASATPTRRIAPNTTAQRRRGYIRASTLMGEVTGRCSTSGPLVQAAICAARGRLSRSRRFVLPDGTRDASGSPPGQANVS